MGGTTTSTPVRAELPVRAEPPLRAETQPPSPLATILATAADHYPERSAIRTETDDVTYRELASRVGELADRLREAGAGPGCVVGVHVPRSAAAIIAIHAVIATGAVVAPLDVNDPADRVASLLDQAGVSHLVRIDAGTTDGETVGTPIGEGLAVIDRGIRPPGLAPGYLLFTSGSTGLPKGVLLSGDAVAHFVRWAAQSIELTADDRVAAQAALTFDLSTFDVFATAVAGATAVLLPDWLKPFPSDTVDWLAENAITVIYAVPTLLAGVVSATGGRGLTDLRAIVFAGEAYPATALAELRAVFPDAQLRNWYGPTETNVCTAQDIREWRSGEAVPVGEGIDGVHIALVDDDLTPAERGEIVVAGPTLLTGYVVDGHVFDPAVEVAFPDGRTRRAYRTGDHAYRDENGRLVLTGRADSQVKRRGYRIDLAGIEAVAADIGRVRTAAAVATGAQHRITLFVDAEPASSTAVLDAVDHGLRDALPIYSQPDRIVAHTPLPINRRGKLDRPRLEEIAAALHSDQEKS